MRRKGVCYDVGRELEGRSWRPDFRPTEVRRELEIIARDLHCTAVRIQSADVSRLGRAAEAALELGLEVWLSPDLWDHDAEDTLAHLVSAAAVAEEVRRHADPGQVFLSVGSELSLFMRGIIPGDTVPERIALPDLDSFLRAAATQQSVNEYLARATAAVRPRFGGQLAYCALPTEHVDWTGFDVAAFDLYRDKINRPHFGRAVQLFRNRVGRPLVIGEFGCCTYRGAADRGGMGFDITDHSGDQPHINGDYVRDEAEQAREITECLDIFDAGGADLAFVQTFVNPLSPWNPDPRFDFDLASYSLVRSFAGRLGDLLKEFPKVPWDTTEHGTAYPDMPWEPKESFRAVAAWNAAH